MNEGIGVPDVEHDIGSNNPRSNRDEPNVEVENFYKLVKDAEKEIYPNCKSFTKLKFIIQLYHTKCLCGMSNKAFTMILELIKKALPEGETLPNSFYESKKLIRQLGLTYNNIDACPNDCILYRKEHANDNECFVCHTPRYVKIELFKIYLFYLLLRGKIMTFIYFLKLGWKLKSCVIFLSYQGYNDCSCHHRRRVI